ncbi:hypothetical protein MSAN_00438700 [Mycena sanguinolenta]|uniref:Uncharacterized protein n=1 Tax=Mycena sanguinolenta TaxID=230812 RepID=A0A8H7DJF2_9AGAR|nr:hypothetical protein MSAN_00438700 [Mycena sanguinolenta]
MRYISGADLVACVERSAAPLQDLALGWEFIPIEMWQPAAEVVSELFTALAESSSLLPNLHDLSIQIPDPSYDLSSIPGPSWRNLVCALSIRRMEQLYIAPVMVSPPIDVLASLRELVANGAEMHVGTEELNFVVA